MCTFTELGIAPAFVEKLAERRISRPTAIQAMVIKPLLEGQSLIFRSATGTGKTFAYLLPALQKITSDPAVPYSGPALLICAPTIELCSQIKSEIDFLLSTKGTQCTPFASMLTGSMNLKRQIEGLKKSKPMAVVGNPGRLLLLAKMGKLKLKGLRWIIFDEADRLTVSDCREETDALIKYIGLGESPLTIAACSATVSEKTREQIPLLKGAALRETDEQEILREQIEHWAIFSESRRKIQTLVSFLAAVKPKKALVFTGRSHDAAKAAAVLQSRHVKVFALFSGMDKRERKSALDRFRSGKVPVLISSDLGARGLDIPDISHIIALDVPETADAYIHRAGRTGRAGRRGIMVSIGDEIEMRRLAVLEKKLGIIVHPKELYEGRLASCNS